MIKINNRKVLFGLTEVGGIPDNLAFECFRAIDKLDKIGKKGVLEELASRGIDKKKSEFLLTAIELRGNGTAILQEFRSTLKGSKVGLEGVDELEMMAQIFEESGVQDNVEFDMSLARGLDYYTGPVFEGRYLGRPNVGSILGGGRYDHLVERFGGPPTPATGISLGIDRLIDILLVRDLSEELSQRLDVFVAPIKRPMVRYAVAMQSNLIAAGIATEVDLMERPLKKLFEQAESKGARYVVIVGARDIEKGEVSVRDMVEKTTEQVKTDNIIDFMKKKLA